MIPPGLKSPSANRLVPLVRVTDFVAVKLNVPEPPEKPDTSSVLPLSEILGATIVMEPVLASALVALMCESMISIRVLA
jgi:hypothetical protein